MTDRLFGTRSFGVGSGSDTALPHTAFTALFCRKADGEVVIACRARCPRGTTQNARSSDNTLHMRTIRELG